MDRASIFVFTTTYFPNIGGAEVAISEVAKRLPHYDWTLFCARLDRSLSKRETIENVAVRRLGWGIPLLDKTLLPFTSFFAVWKIYANRKAQSAKRSGETRDDLRFALSDSPVILWSVMASYASFGALFLKLLRPKLPFILTLQEGDSEQHVKSALLKAGPFRRLLFRRVDFVTVISEYLGWFARRLGYYGQIKLVPNGVDLKRFDVENLSLKSKAIKATLGIPADAPIVISSSRLAEKNGLEDLIRGFARLGRSDAHLFILGDGVLQEHLETVAQETDAHERMHFLGTIPHAEVPDYIGIADVFVRPSLSEGQGVSFLEAMAIGVPIVGTSVGGIPDFLKDGETGLFCEVQNPASIASAIERLLNDHELRNRIIENAYRLVKERYEWEKIAPMMEGIFEKISKS